MRLRLKHLLPPLLFGMALAFLSLGSTPEDDSRVPLSPQAPCANPDPNRRPYFGDLHVHTSLSIDASTRGTRALPADAYAFAKGGALGLPPYNKQGQPGHEIRLDRPLDFAAVTDHAELLGEAALCANPDSPAYDNYACKMVRRWPGFGGRYLLFGAVYLSKPHRFSLCGPHGERCSAATGDVWKLIRQAAEDAQDHSPECKFSAFVAYEWTLSPGGTNLHRNVIFKDSAVPRRPISVYEASRPEALWRQLQSQCRDSIDGCDVLAIPHNSNVSNGLMFRTVNSDGTPMTAEDARRRADLEPLVEIMQSKGDSECIPGSLNPDEQCGFEKLNYRTFTENALNMGSSDAPPSSFVRSALGEGLKLEESLGVNPFKLGIIASTDTHMAAAGYVTEDDFIGHGFSPPSRSNRASLPDLVVHNPGGLTAVWAEENSRASLFAAMKRRETFGTSGPRMSVRFFGGTDWPSDLCARPDAVSYAYQHGVSMGGDLKVVADGKASFFFDARMDVGTDAHPGTQLERVQLVKGWLEGGKVHEEVVDVLGQKSGPIPETGCAALPGGAERLCGVWQDPHFVPGQQAYYYVRVLELPTCRWSARLCDAKGVSCAEGKIPDGLEACCAKGVPRRIQERAWSSPIWYSP